MEDIDGGLHPAVDGQSLDEDEDEDHFFNPTPEIVTFHLCGWCLLGVLLLPAFTRLGHECQDLSRRCNGMHVYTD